MEVYFGR